MGELRRDVDGKKRVEQREAEQDARAPAHLLRRGPVCSRATPEARQERQVQAQRTRQDPAQIPGRSTPEVLKVSTGVTPRSTLASRTAGAAMPRGGAQSPRSTHRLRLQIDCRHQAATQQACRQT